MTVALPMYDLPEVAGDLDALWTVLRRVAADGIGRALPERLDRPADLHRSWQAPDLVLSQTCGYPLVGALTAGDDAVHVVGAFTHLDARSDGGGPAPAGHYRSVLVAGPGLAGRAGDAWTGTRAAVNGWWSLSGWISLLAATGQRAPWPGEVVVTGAHRASLAALRTGRADVASIDAVTFGLIEQHAPAELDGLRVCGRGPLVPALPLVTAAAELVEPWRRAIAAALASDESASARRRLRITGFAPLDRRDYDVVAELADATVGAPPSWPDPGTQRNSSESARLAQR